MCYLIFFNSCALACYRYLVLQYIFDRKFCSKCIQFVFNQRFVVSFCEGNQNSAHSFSQCNYFLFTWRIVTSNLPVRNKLCQVNFTKFYSRALFTINWTVNYIFLHYKLKLYFYCFFFNSTSHNANWGRKRPLQWKKNKGKLWIMRYSFLIDRNIPFVSEESLELAQKCSICPTCWSSVPNFGRY